MRPVMARLARWDRETAARVDRYVAISHYVAGRIGRYYNRVASVVYPPVDTLFFAPSGVAPERYALVVSALVPYKRVDLAVEACARAGLPLKVVGDGPERAVLERRAKGDTTFLGRRSDEEVRELYRRAAVVLLPGEEDFGIVPVEAQACGTPVIALGRGGALETVLDGVTGVLVGESTPAALAAGIARAQQIPFDRAVIRTHAVRFDRAVFSRAMQSTIESLAHG
jgi:glycosyltransferase involved in cell wall biosynthesis